MYLEREDETKRQASAQNGKLYLIIFCKQCVKFPSFYNLIRLLLLLKHFPSRNWKREDKQTRSSRTPCRKSLFRGRLCGRAAETFSLFLAHSGNVKVQRLSAPPPPSGRQKTIRIMLVYLSAGGATGRPISILTLRVFLL